MSSQGPVQPVLLSDDPNYVVVKIGKQTADGEIVELVFRSLKSDVNDDIDRFIGPLHSRMIAINRERLSAERSSNSSAAKIVS